MLFQDLCQIISRQISDFIAYTFACFICVWHMQYRAAVISYEYQEGAVVAVLAVPGTLYTNALAYVDQYFTPEYDFRCVGFIFHKSRWT